MSSFYDFIGSTCAAAQSQGNTLDADELNEIFSAVMTDSHEYDDARGVSSAIRAAIRYFERKGDEETVEAIHSVTGY